MCGMNDDRYGWSFGGGMIVAERCPLRQGGEQDRINGLAG